MVSNVFAIWALCNIYDVDMKRSGLVAFSIIATAFIWAFYGISIFLSSLFRSKLSVVLSTVVLVIGFFVFSSLSNVVEKLRDFDHFSLFYLYTPQKILQSGEYSLNHLVILIAIALAGILSSIYLFNKKDLS